MKRMFALILASVLLLCACHSGGNVSDTGSDSVSDTVSEESIFTPASLDNSLLVVFGDSITALGTWGKTVAENCNMRFFNGAAGGITSAQGLARFDAFVASRNPDYVTLCFGMNDLLMTAVDTPKVSPEQFKKNMASLVEKVRELDAVPILLTTNTLDVNVFFASQGQDKSMYGGRDILEWLDTYNDMTRAVAEETGCHLIDLRAECGKYPVNQIVRGDGIHLSENGNKVFADTVTAYMLENFERDPDAPEVNYDNSVLLSTGESASLTPFEKDMWYVDGYTIRVSVSDNTTDKLVFRNTNGLWPDAQCCYTQGIKVPVDSSSLSIRLTTANVNASVLLYFDGAYPHAYAEGQYLCINPYLNCETDSYTGDITANQTIDIEIPLSSLPVSSACIHDGYLVISGIKIYVAGQANQPVTIEYFDVAVK